MLEILTAAEIKQAEAFTKEAGLSGVQLMTAAGSAVASEITHRFEPSSALVLCGSGNNGGDGFIAAAHLKKAGWKVRVASTVKRTALKGDAALAAKAWDGEVVTLNSNLSVHHINLVVDAVYGSGFRDTINPELTILFEKIKTKKIPVVAIDIPSGINTTTGTVDPATLPAVLTVTFTRKQYAHTLYPARAFCGAIHIADIGIRDESITALSSKGFENNVALWLKNYPIPTFDTHKYKRGHVVVYGAEVRTGAACLAAAAAQKIGAGAVTITSSAHSKPIYQNYRASLMVDECNNIDDFKTVLRDERKNTFVIGCGADEKIKDYVDAALVFNKPGVLDGGVFSAYKDSPQELFSKLKPHHVLTPHEGEFARLFGHLDGNKVERALKAAKLANAIIVLKGADTVIAAPDGTHVVNTNAPPSLATAGAGDVLAGMIGGLMAQGMPPFMAAAAAIYIHAEAAKIQGFGLTAEDIIINISQTLNAIFQ